MATSGVTMARQNRLVTVPEATVGVVNGSGTPLYATDITTGGAGFSNPQNWAEHIPDGLNAATARALVGSEGLVSGTFMPQYALLPNRLSAICGAPATNTLIETDTRRRRTWLHPDKGAPSIETFSAYYGLDALSARLLFGKVRSFNIDVTRNSDGGSLSGNIELHFNGVARNQSTPGDEPAVIQSAYLEPNHSLVYRAVDDAALAAIDMSAADDARLITDCVGHTFAMADLWNPFYTENRSRFATNMVAGAQTVTASVTVPKDNEGICEALYATEEGCTATPFWLRFAWKCGTNEFWIDLYCSRNDAVAKSADNNVYLHNFPVARTYHPDGSLRFTHIEAA